MKYIYVCINKLFDLTCIKNELNLYSDVCND